LTTSTSTASVIVGGGFAGLGCARKLADHEDVHVTLIGRNNYHQLQPPLYQVATSQARRNTRSPICARRRHAAAFAHPSSRSTATIAHGTRRDERRDRRRRPDRRCSSRRDRRQARPCPRDKRGAEVAALAAARQPQRVSETAIRFNRQSPTDRRRSLAMPTPLPAPWAHGRFPPYVHARRTRAHAPACTRVLGGVTCRPL
jgi:glycine/D-amino acid oxidase-like deaminating enzyme